MGLTSIPTEIDGSLGRDKVDLDTPPNLTEYVPTAEYNNLKKAVAEMAAAMGLADGTTAASLEMLKRAMNDPARARPDDFVDIDDFSFINLDKWTKIATGGAAVTMLTGDYGPSDRDVAGVLRLYTPSSGDDAGIKDAITWFHGGHNPVLRALVKTPGDITTLDLTIGFSDNPTSHANYAYFKATASGWNVYCGRGGTDSETGLGSCAVYTWYELRIELVHSDKVRFYVDDTLIATLDAVGAVPSDADKLGRFALSESSSGSARSVLIDYLDLRLTRAATGAV